MKWAWGWLSILTILCGLLVAMKLYYVSRIEWWDRTESFREGIEGLRYQSERHKWNVIRDVGRAASGEETMERLYRK